MSNDAAGVPSLLKVLVVDDEPLGRERILELLPPKLADIVGTASDGAMALDRIRELKPDIVFLDVQMPRMSGLDVVRELDEANAPVIVFVTAFDEYAISAFDASAVDYLVKPFRDDRFRIAFERARERVLSKDASRQNAELRARLQSGADSPAVVSPKYLERIAVQMHGKVRVVLASEIEIITASGPYVDLHVAKRRFVIRESMQNLADRLDPNLFLRIHRSTIVRLELIDSLLRHEGSEYEVQLKDGRRLRVGRSRLEALEARLGEFL
jgi:two-component system LytT family response regulator